MSPIQCSIHLDTFLIWLPEQLYCLLGLICDSGAICLGLSFLVFCFIFLSFLALFVFFCLFCLFLSFFVFCCCSGWRGNRKYDWKWSSPGDDYDDSQHLKIFGTGDPIWPFKMAQSIKTEFLKGWAHCLAGVLLIQPWSALIHQFGANRHALGHLSMN